MERGTSNSEQLANGAVRLGEPAVLATDGHHQRTCTAAQLSQSPEGQAAGAPSEGAGPVQQLQSSGIIRPTKKRYLILCMFIVLCAIKSFQWICFAGITNIIASYYQVDNIAVNWTTISFMLTFLLLALPVCWLMERIGLRRSMLIGTLGNTLGLIIKCFSCHPNGFYVNMSGHLLVGLTEPFFFSINTQLASRWFPDNQVASATSMGIIGDQLGIALGFIVPSLMLSHHRPPSSSSSLSSSPSPLQTNETPLGQQTDLAAADWTLSQQEIQQALFRLFLGLASLSTLNTVAIFFLFDDGPKHAPGVARYKQMLQAAANSGGGGTMERRLGTADKPRIDNDQLVANTTKEQQRPTGGGSSSHFGQLFRLASGQRSFVSLALSYGIVMGSNYAIHTILNQMIVTGSQWENAGNLTVAKAGLLLIFAGLFGSLTFGYLLDSWHRHKATTMVAGLLSVLSMLALTACLRVASSEWILYLAMAPLGFFLTGYSCCGLDFAVELTYPSPELVSATLLNISAQIFGIIISLLSSHVVDQYGNQASGFFLSFLLLAGSLPLCRMKGAELRRQKAAAATNGGSIVGRGDPSLAPAPFPSDHLP